MADALDDFVFNYFCYEDDDDDDVEEEITATHNHITTSSLPHRRVLREFASIHILHAVQTEEPLT